MGADITITDKNGTKLFYFRDSYNTYNLLWQLDGSYWEMAEAYKTTKERITYLKGRINYFEEKYLQHKWKLLFKREIYSYFMKQLKELKELIRVYEEDESNRFIDWSV